MLMLRVGALCLHDAVVNRGLWAFWGAACRPICVLETEALGVYGFFLLQVSESLRRGSLLLWLSETPWSKAQV